MSNRTIEEIENMNKRLKKTEDNNKSINLTNEQIFKLFDECNYNMINNIISNKNGFDINMIINGRTLLFRACEKNNKEVIQLLLLNAATDVNKATADFHWQTPLFRACLIYGNPEVVRLLLAHDNINVNQAETKHGETSLYKACECGYEAVVRLLLAHPETDVNQVMNDGTTPLFRACQKRRFGVVQLLLAHAATDVNQARNDGATPLYGACQRGHEGVVWLLLTHTATKVNQPDNSGTTPMDIACQQHQTRLNTFSCSYHRLNTTKTVELLLADSRTKRINISVGSYYKVYYQALKNVISKRNARFRGLIRAAVVFKRMQLRAALKIYAPGGAGFQAASTSFAAAIDK